jgi:hypothetical protein
MADIINPVHVVRPLSSGVTLLVVPPFFAIVVSSSCLLFSLIAPVAIFCWFCS